MRRDKRQLAAIRDLPANPDPEKECEEHQRFVDRRPGAEPRCRICHDTYCGVCATDFGHTCCPAHRDLEPVVNVIVLQSTRDVPPRYVNNARHSQFARR